MHLEFQEYNITPTLIANTTKTINGAINAWSSEFMTARVNPSTVTIQLAVYMDEDGASYIDSVQFEAKAYPTTYCDGDQEGCYWTGTPHASQSKRPATERTGGRVWNFRDFGFDVIDTIGAGAPPVNVIDTPFALIGGGYYQRTTYPIRQFSIVGAFTSSSRIAQARQRAAMLGALRPDLVAPQQPVRLVYETSDCNDAGVGASASANAILIDGVYAGGLEGQLANSEIDRAAISFRTHDAAIIGKSIQDTASALAFAQTLSVAGRLIVRNRTTGDFSQLFSAPNGTVRAIVRAPRGGVYVGGEFTSPQTRIGHYNPATDTWTALGVGANGTVRALCVGPDGLLYAGGDFTSIGGVAVTGLARWNGSTWAAVGGSVAGGSARVQSILFSPQNYLYIGGSFTSVNGVAASNVARYLTFWEAMGAGANAEVLALANQSAEDVYVGGAFTSAGGLTAYGIAKWNGAVWSRVGGTGLLTATERINSMAFAPDGRLFVTGEFGDGMAQATDAANVAVWSGTWSGLDGGFSDIGTLAARLSDDTMYVAGEFFDDGNPVRAVDYGAIRNGNTWVNPDLQPNAPAVYAYAFDNQYEYYGGSFTVVRTGDVTAVELPLVLTAQPRLVFTGPCTLVCVKNFTTGDALYFNLALLTNERAVLSFGSGNASTPTFTSNTRGDILSTIIAPSNLATFRFVPGTNHLYVFMLNVGGSNLASLIYKRGYESIDQIA